MTRRSFLAIQRELGLMRRQASALGTVHFVPVVPAGQQRLHVHQFPDLPPDLVMAYAELHRRAQDWVQRDWDLENLLRVAQPVEVGEDFIAFPFLHGNSTRDFDLGDDTPTVPELSDLRDRYSWVYQNTRTAGDERVTEVLTPHILQPSTHTLFVPRESMFVVVDLEPTREQLHQWAALAPAERRISTRAEILADEPE